MSAHGVGHRAGRRAGGTSRPASPSVPTTSGRAPAAFAITERPQAIASLAGKPKPSKNEGTTMMRPSHSSTARTSSGVSRKRSWSTIWMRSERPYWRDEASERGRRRGSGRRRSSASRCSGSIESASNIVPMPFLAVLGAADEEQVGLLRLALAIRMEDARYRCRCRRPSICLLRNLEVAVSMASRREACADRDDPGPVVGRPCSCIRRAGSRASASTRLHEPTGRP